MMDKEEQPMGKYSFLNDYSEGCHPDILTALSRTNRVQQTGYGEDEYSLRAKQLIRDKMNSLSSGVYLVSGGTQANLTLISSVLKSHEAVVSAETGHILVHETGAIEATGHKIISVGTNDGKLSPDDVQAVLTKHDFAPHMVKPKLVYISNATELGTVYTRRELEVLYNFCREKDLFLFLDGARLATALTSEKSDLTFADLALLTDVLYIGGTKNGALMGEAIVINNKELNRDFPYHVKQRGAMLAKGRVLGIQFLELFRDELYFELAIHANTMARKISAAIVEKGYALSAETETNLIFPVLPNHLIDQLNEKFGFYVWGIKDEEHSIVRLVTSWATDEEMVDKFIENL